MRFEPAAGRLDASRIKHCYEAGYWRDEVVVDLLAKHAKERPNSAAVIDGIRQVSWDELYQSCVRFALHLKRLDINPGDAVALQLPNWLEYVICYHGILLVGGIVVQIGADWRSTEMAYGLGIGPAKMVIIPKQFLGHDYLLTLQQLRPTLPKLEHILVARGNAPENFISLDNLLADPIESRVDSAILNSCKPGPDDIIRIVFTSGTTGLPKAIMHTSNTLAHSARTTQTDFQHNAKDVFLIYLPYSTNFGSIMGLQLAVSVGAKIVLMDGFSATKSLELIEKENVTFIPGTPTAFIALSNSSKIENTRLDSLRLLISAGASFPVQSIKELRQKFKTTFIDSFGMNEFGMGFWTLPGLDPNEIDGSIGHTISGVEARIIDNGGATVSRGEIGELVIKSAGMCAGYFNNPEANSSSWDTEGWFFSGDLATEDDKGNFRIVGRKKDVIIRGGANVSPREIEEILTRQPQIREVSVIGLPDDHYGEIVCACIIPKHGKKPTTNQILAYLETRISAYKKPARVVLMEKFPVNSMGKVKKDMLREQVLGLMAPTK